eukprot:1442198-Pyramimonas_sp.AAC.1
MKSSNASFSRVSGSNQIRGISLLITFDHYCPDPRGSAPGRLVSQRHPHSRREVLPTVVAEPRDGRHLLRGRAHG